MAQPGGGNDINDVPHELRMQWAEDPESLSKEKAALKIGSRTQFQYNLEEKNHIDVDNEVLLHLSKEKKLLRALANEHSSLATTGRLVTNSFNLKRDQITRDKLNDVVDEKIRYEEKLAGAKLSKSELEERVADAEKRVYQARMLTKQLNSVAGEAKRKVKRDIQLLESRLGIKTVELNKAMKRNQKLRETIDQLLQERMTYKHMVDAAMNKLDKGKTLVHDIVSMANFAFENREDTEVKIKMVDEHFKNTLETNSQFMRERDRELFNCLSRLKFAAVKNQTRDISEYNKNTHVKNITESQKVENNVRHLQHIFRDLFAILKVPGKEMLAPAIKRREEEIFSVFNYVNEVSSEVEALHKESEDLRSKILDEITSRKSKSQTRDDIMYETEEKLADLYDYLEPLEYKMMYRRKQLISLLAALDKLIHLAKCDRTPIFQLLGKNHRITRFNYRPYLKIFEKQMFKIIAAVWSKEISNIRQYLPLKHHIMAKPRPNYEYHIIAGGRIKVLKDDDEDDAKPFPTPCPLCTEMERVMSKRDVLDEVLTRDEAFKSIAWKFLSPTFDPHLHTVSNCRLPGAKLILQKRIAL